jgi:hypothetical protein
MAKKVFRIQNGANSVSSNWFNSNGMNANSIVANVGNGKNLPTSIPSPFARLDLVKAAFEIVAKSPSLDGILKNGKITISDNHKLVSDALDIGQIFFNFDTHKDILSISVWDKKTRFK